jgi:hypothetical protein
LLSLWFALPVAAIIIGIGIHALVLKVLWAGYGKKRQSLSPEDRQPAAPGRYPRQRIGEVAVEIKAHRFCAMLQPVFLTVICVIYYRYHSRLDFQFLVTSIIACGLVFLYCIWNLVEKGRTHKRLRLEYGAEVEVGQALDQLNAQGYQVFHGIKQGDFDIDHLLVGPKGVFAIETKGHPRPSPKRGTEAATVTYNGHALFFPRGTDEHTVANAVRQAERLSEWLGSGTGEAISARAVVVMPGWFVKRTTSDGAPVVNPDQFKSLFEHIASRPLSEAQITRIADLVRQKCGWTVSGAR